MRARAVTPAVRAVADRGRGARPQCAVGMRDCSDCVRTPVPAARGTSTALRPRTKERVMQKANNLLLGTLVGVLGLALGVGAGCQSGPKESSRDIPASAQTRAELGIYKWHFVVD